MDWSCCISVSVHVSFFSTWLQSVVFEHYQYWASFTGLTTKENFTVSIVGFCPAHGMSLYLQKAFQLMSLSEESPMMLRVMEQIRTQKLNQEPLAPGQTSALITSITILCIHNSYAPGYNLMILD